jgi:CheY-like chemotaxis protein/HPt (histidine-containing phosphotransfer) domain-containing protein
MNSAVDPTPSAQSFRILLVDDSVINRTVTLRLLQTAGLSADVASSGAEAIAAHEKQSYDLIVMDVQMPEMDGLEATRRIRAVVDTNPVIIGLTANAMGGDRDKCLAAGMNDYLSKPIDPDAFAAALKQWIIKIQSGAAVTASRQKPAVESNWTVVNLKRLEHFTDGSKEAIQELVDLYLENTTKYFATLESAIGEADVDKIRRAAHKAAGSSATCGMDFLAEAFREIERNAEFQNAKDAQLLYEQALTEFTRVRTALSAQLS